MSDDIEMLLETDNKKIVLEIGRDGKFVVKSVAWEDNRVMLKCDVLDSGREGDRVIVRRRPPRRQRRTRRTAALELASADARR